MHSVLINFWDAFCFEYNMKNQLDLNVQSHSGMLQTAAEFIQKQLLRFSSDCPPPVLLKNSLVFICLQASMWGNQHVGFCGGECHSNP